MRQVLIERPGRPNRRTIVHWAAVFILAVSGLLTVLTAIYFLVLPSGGYQGGRNEHYGQTLWFGRDVWVDIHTWAGIILVAISLIHIALHWSWVAEMTKRSWAIVRGRRKPFNRRIWARVGVVATVGLVFLWVAASGVYFFVVPGGHGAGQTAVFVFSRSTWDLIHTWTGIVMIIAGVVHLGMRWKWVVRVTPSVVRTALRRGPAVRQEPIRREPLSERGSL
jgi:hypothetical protein